MLLFVFITVIHIYNITRLTQRTLIEQNRFELFGNN